ncbi:MAG: hypothetical protein F6K04_13620 [Leptolyngbya sp. SIO4C5]|nr:hypothetical protein [Leptolyngbya sp. SIO4C5]
MAKPCCAPLKTNPFISQRDPKTGRWQVIVIQSKGHIRWRSPQKSPA